MNVHPSERTEILERLHEMLIISELPTKAMSSCSSLLEKLQQPVRIGLFGAPGVGKRRVINALLQEQVLELDLDLPTFDLSFGAETQTHAILQDGASITSTGFPNQDIAKLAPMFLQVRAPLKHVEGREYLVIAADPTLEDMTAAFEWAATRVDVALFCTQNWSSFEQQIWRSAPDTLRNHAVLVVTDGPGNTDHQELNAGPEDGFETIFREQRTTSSYDPKRCQFGGLTGHLQNTIVEGSTEDIHAAQLFLHRYGERYRTRSRPIAQPQYATEIVHAPNLSVPELPAVPEPVLEPSPEPERVAVKTPQTEPRKVDIPEDAVIALSKLFQFLRRSAEGLRQQFPAPRLSQDDAEHHLSALDEIFDQLAERAIEQDVLEEHWPDLCDNIHDARDLALLMRVEGGLDQVRDAAMLLLQIRQDVEFRLAA